MKIGILDADHLSPSIIKKFGCYAERFVHLFSPLPASVSFNRYTVFDCEYPQSMDECDAYIITGSQYSTYEDFSWIKQLEEYIRQLHQHKKKLIGICFGHQLIAQSLGGKVEKNSQGWEIGITATHITETRITDPLDWMQPNREFFFSLVSHQDHVTRLPENAINFCSTNLCLYSGFYIDTHILTFQGHPEFSKDYLKLIIKLQSKNLSLKQRQGAKASLQQSDDHELIANWIFNFLKT